MSMKFDAAFNDRFKLHLELLGEVGQLTEDMGRLLAKNVSADKFIVTALQFAKICSDTSPNIMRNLRDGQIAHAVVLVRWFLEMAHLCHYLWQNPEQHQGWLAGQQVHPKTVRKWFTEKGYATWGESYSDWSNFVHGNSVFVENYTSVAVRTPTNERQLLIVSYVLRNLLFLSTKLNYVFGKSLQPYIGDDFRGLALRYNDLEKRIWQISDEHNAWERSFMGSSDNNKDLGEERSGN